MSTTIQEHAGTLVVVRCWCGIQHAIPESLRKLQIAEKDRGKEQVVFCPLGHEYVAGGKTEAERLRKEVEWQKMMRVREQASHDQTKAELETSRHRLRATKAAHTRTKNRVGKGVCPCCNRHFKDLERHMSGQHPEYANTEE